MASTYVPLALVTGDILNEERAAHLETQVSLAKGVRWPLGGIPNLAVNDESYRNVPGFIVVPVSHDRTVQMELMGSVSGGTGSARLWNATDSEEVADSEITFTDTDPTLQLTPHLELAAGKSYTLRIKISDDAEEVSVYGGSLVTQ